MTRRVVESDVCIIGSGISAAMVADRLARTTSARVVVVEAGDNTVPLTSRGRGARSLHAIWRESVGTRSPRGIRNRGAAAVSLDAGRRAGDALGCGDAALLARRLQAAHAVRRRHGLADRLRRARSVLSRSRRGHGRGGRTRPARPGPAPKAVPAAGDSPHVQSRASEGVGGQGRHPDVEPALGQELDRLPRTTAVLSQRHLLADLPDRRQVLSRFHLEYAARDEADRADAANAGAEARARGRRQDHLARRRVELRSARHAGRVAREDVRPRGGLRVVVAPVAALGAERCAGRRSEQIGARRQVPLRTSKRGRLRRPAAATLSGDERATQSGDEAVHANEAGHAIHSARPPRSGNRRSARRQGSSTTRERCCSATPFSKTGASGRRRARRAFARTTR